VVWGDGVGAIAICGSPSGGVRQTIQPITASRSIASAAPPNAGTGETLNGAVNEFRVLRHQLALV
jgi:hypothetical protein